MKNSENIKFEYINKLIFVQQYNQAEKQLNDLANQSKDSIVHLRRIELALKLDKTKTLAEEYRKKYEETQDKVYLAFENLCYQFSDSIDGPESIALFQTILKADPTLAICYYGIAVALETSGQVERAIYNYQQSLNVDPGFYPSYFGLSQIYYHNSNQEQGDHYFYLFENAAPYNVYGNFDTHRKLAHEFTEMGKYDYAEASIKNLSKWWLDNKGECPKEIQVFECLALAKICLVSSNLRRYEDLIDRSKDIAYKILTVDSTSENVLYFISKLFEEYTDFDELVFEFYSKIISSPNVSSEMVQKIGGHLLSFDSTETACNLFKEGYNANPDHEGIRFCYLVAKLKHADVDVEEYLQGKDRLHYLLSNNGDKVETLALLHSLSSRFQNDQELHLNLAIIYGKLGNNEKEAFHIEKMYDIDPLGKDSLIKYSEYLTKIGEYTRANELLETLSKRDGLDEETYALVDMIRVQIHLDTENYDKANDIINSLLSHDPWDLNYLIKKFHCVYSLNVKKVTSYSLDPVILNIERDEEVDDSDWEQFDRLTEIYYSMNLFEFAYLRRKIRFLYGEGEAQYLRKFLKIAIEYNTDQACGELVKLINTNFDSPDIYYALGMLYKSMWNHEVAIMWLESATRHNKITKALLAEVYQEIADTYNWGRKDYKKALEFGNLSMQLGAHNKSGIYTSMAHSYLKMGEVRSARLYLDKVPETDLEAEFLRGLLDYREGLESKAKTHWKPLLTVSSKNVKVHQIKKEIHRFYFREEEYLKAN